MGLGVGVDDAGDASERRIAEYVLNDLQCFCSRLIGAANPPRLLNKDKENCNWQFIVRVQSSFPLPSVSVVGTVSVFVG